jgi:hypothetical protein
MEICDASYFAFCDQDDVWFPNKIDLMMNEVRRLEGQFGETTPILVHTDLVVVDKKLNQISPSLLDHLYLNASRRRRLDYLLFDNIVTGCALIGNRALLDLTRPIPAGIPYHDWWVALVAASCGVVSTVAEPTVLYRQHDGNLVGAGRRRGRKTLRDARYMAQQPRKMKLTIVRVILALQFRASLLLQTVGAKMPPRNREFLRALSLPRSGDEAAHLPWMKRTWLYFRCLMLYVRMLPIIVHRCF